MSVGETTTIQWGKSTTLIVQEKGEYHSVMFTNTRTDVPSDQKYQASEAHQPGSTPNDAEIYQRAKQIASKCLFLHPKELMEEAKQSLTGGGQGYIPRLSKTYSAELLNSKLLGACQEIKKEFKSSPIETLGFNNYKAQVRIRLPELMMPRKEEANYAENVEKIRKIGGKILGCLPTDYKDLVIKFRFKPEIPEETKEKIRKKEIPPPCKDCDHVNIVVYENGTVVSYPSKSNKANNELFKKKIKTTEIGKKPRPVTILVDPENKEKKFADINAAVSGFSKAVLQAGEFYTATSLGAVGYGPKIHAQSKIFVQDPTGEDIERMQLIQEGARPGEELLRFVKEDPSFENIQKYLQHRFMLMEALSFCESALIGVGDLKDSNTLWKILGKMVKALLIDAFHQFKKGVSYRQQLEELNDGSYRSTAPFASPEEFYSIKKDVWSFGIMAAEFILRKEPIGIGSGDENKNPLSMLYHFVLTNPKAVAAGKPARYMPLTKKDLTNEDVQKAIDSLDSLVQKEKTELEKQTAQFCLDIFRECSKIKVKERPFPKELLAKCKKHVAKYPELQKMKLWE